MMYVKVAVAVASAALVTVASQRCLAQRQPCGACQIRFVAGTAHDFIDPGQR